jgi:Peptidase family M28
MKSRRFYAVSAAMLALSLTASAGVRATAPQGSTNGGAASITPEELREWLSYIASDQLQGRQVYTEGLGLAAAYIADHLKEWGVKPGGDDGSYFQTVKVLGVNTKSNSSVTVSGNGTSRTFKDGEGVTFARNQGGKQTVTGSGAFVGYGLNVPDLKQDDYKGRDVSGKVVVYVGRGPQNLPFRTLTGRARNAIELHHAVAAIGPMVTFGRGGTPPASNAQAPATPPSTDAAAQPGRGQAGAGQFGGGRGGQTIGDFQTVQRLDTKTPPQITASDEFFEFLFNAAGQKYADLKAAADRQDALPAASLDGVTITINIDASYEVVQTRLTRNVVGVVEGSDPALKDTYVLFGAHYDHIGYQQFGTAGRGGVNAGGCTGQTRDTPRPGDIINNGADDDGSGTVSVMAIAKAFAQGPKPKRSVMFVWHAGEEAGLLGSRYMADYPEVPLEKVAAQLNIDMVGRNRCDQASESNTVYLVGSDRISTELHNLNEDANASLPTPLKLDYEYNDPADPESIYTRSDHYSYAAKGIPIIFFTTGLHRDYHYLTDEVSKIEFPKMSHIAQLVYQTGWKVANLDHFPVRDNKGPRKGKGASGKISN